MTVHGGSSPGLGILILGVGLLMGGLAVYTLRSVWRRTPTAPGPRGPAGGGSPPPRPMPVLLRAVLSIDFGCLALVAAVLTVLGLVLLLRAIAG